MINILYNRVDPQVSPRFLYIHRYVYIKKFTTNKVKYLLYLLEDVVICKYYIVTYF